MSLAVFSGRTKKSRRWSAIHFASRTDHLAAESASIWSATSIKSWWMRTLAVSGTANRTRAATVGALLATRTRKEDSGQNGKRIYSPSAIGPGGLLKRPSSNSGVSHSGELSLEKKYS